MILNYNFNSTKYVLFTNKHYLYIEPSYMENVINKESEMPSYKKRVSNIARVKETKNKIYKAVIFSLDKNGYNETSVNRIQEIAGVSRGALTHHFPSKEELIVETLERILNPKRGLLQDNARHLNHVLKNLDSFEEDLFRYMNEVLNTEKGRALVEILIASRTDKDLKVRITPILVEYNDEINKQMGLLYSHILHPENKIDLHWTICRAFLRGLHIQKTLEMKNNKSENVIKEFAAIMAPYFNKKN